MVQIAADRKIPRRKRVAFRLPRAQLTGWTLKGRDMNALAKDTTAAALATEQDPRWAAVVARDRSADGTFYCCVVTTGVYCRPSCSGRPLPKNVRFHRTRADAELAGFRPCKRCKPDRLDANAGVSTA
jgi:hypothetical protein